MSSLSKKIKNREKTKKNHEKHKLVKSVTKEQVIIRRYEQYVNERVYDGLNIERMRTCHIQSVYAFYVLHKDFKMPWKELNRMFQFVAKYAKMYQEQLADANDAIDCLEDEIGFVYPHFEVSTYKVADILKVPEGQERDKFIRILVDSHKRAFIMEARVRFETQILMALHDEYGFGKKRLGRFLDELRGYYDLPEETYREMIDYLNEKANMGLVGYDVVADKVSKAIKNGENEDHSLRPVGRFFAELRAKGRVG